MAEETEKVPTHTATIEKPLASIDYYVNTSTTGAANVFSLKVQAPTKEEASELFTEKLKELKLQDNGE